MRQGIAPTLIVARVAAGETRPQSDEPVDNTPLQLDADHHIQLPPPDIVLVGCPLLCPIWSSNMDNRISAVFPIPIKRQIPRSLSRSLRTISFRGVGLFLSKSQANKIQKNVVTSHVFSSTT